MSLQVSNFDFGKDPNLVSAFSSTNPGTFMATGTVFAAAQSVLTITPTTVSAQGVSFGFYVTEPTLNQMSPFQPNTSFTCTAYDNGTLIGSATSTTVNDPTDSMANCRLEDAPHGTPPNTAEIMLPNASLKSGDTYTFLLSH